MASRGQGKSVASGDAEIRYDVHGEGSPAVVFIPGWTCTRHYFDDMISHLGSPGTFVTVDPASQGDSTAGSGPWTVERFAQDVLAVMDAEELDNAIVAGHSSGGAVALEVARAAPGRVTRVVGIDAFCHLPTYRAQPDAAVTASTEAMRSDFPANIALGMDGNFNPAGDPAVKERVLREIGSSDPTHALPALHSILTWDMDAALEATEVPVTVLAASGMMSPEAPEVLGERCDVRVLDLGGHFFFIEQPQETADETRKVIGG